MKQSTRILCLCLILSLLALCFAACNGGDGTTVETGYTPGNTDPNADVDPNSALVRSGLEQRDYSGQEMTVWYSTVSGWSPYPLEVSDEDGNSGNIIYEAGYDRNLALEELLNIELSYTPSETDANIADLDTLRNMGLTGDISKYDMVMTGARPVGTLTQEGFYFDLNSSDYINATADYYEAQMNKQAQINGKQYFASGYYSVMNTAALQCVWVNEDILIDSVDMDRYAVYDLVLNKEWTFSKMLELGANYATPDANTGSLTSDRYAYLLPSNGCRAIYYDLGGTAIEYNEETWEYKVTINSVQNQELFTWIQENVTKNINCAMIANDDTRTAFQSGAAPFWSATMYQMSYMLDSDVNWAIVPTPLFEAGDDYRATSQSYNLNFAGIPALCDDTDKAGYLYELFMCLSYDYVYPAYYEDCFSTRYQPEEVGAQVFDILASSRYICIGEIYRWFSGTDPQTIISSPTAGVGSTTQTMYNTLIGKLMAFLDNDLIK